MTAPPSLAEYSAGLRSHLQRELAGGLDALAQFEARLAFERRLYRSEWFGGWLPADIGGHGWPSVYRVAFEQELAAAGLPDRVARIGQNLFLPALVEFGSAELRERFVRPTLLAEILWCQGFSEPDAGSDLASLRTRGQIVDGSIVVTGQKVWTSLAHVADYCFCLVRTDDSGAKQHGITFLVFDMKSPGVEVRPIRQIDGNREFSEVFLDEVVVPIDNVVGAIDQGWQVANHTLRYERSTANIGRQARYAAELRRLAWMVSRDPANPSDQEVLGQLGRFAVDAEIMRCASESIATLDENAGSLVLDGSLAKLQWSEAHQRLTKWACEQAEVLWAAGVIDGTELDFWRRAYLSARAETIYAGSSEIQRNIVAQRGIGLPR